MRNTLRVACKNGNITDQFEVKRWIILDRFTNKILYITDQDFKEGLENKYLDLRGQYIEVENKKQIWIDAITK